MKGDRGIFERPKHSGIWWIRYSDASGREHRQKVGSRAQARRAYVDRKAEAQKGKLLPAARPIVKLNELLEDLLAHWSASGAYRKTGPPDLKQVRKAFGDCYAAAITTGQIVAWLRDLRKQRNLAPRTVNHYRQLLATAFQVGISLDKVERNPVDKVPKMKESKGRVRYLSRDEEGRIRAAIESLCPDRLPLFEVALLTGMRQGEQLGLRWMDIDFHGSQITLDRTKNGSARSLPLTARTTRIFEGLKKRAEGEFVFGSPAGCRPPRFSQKWWRAVLNEACIDDFHWHDLRHTFASRAVMNGVGLIQLQALLGHKTIAMTQRYSHLSDEHKRMSMEKATNEIPD